MSVNDKTLPTLTQRSSPGRPTKRTKKLVTALLEAIAIGAPYKIACASVGLHIDTFFNWRREDPSFNAKVEEVAAKGAIAKLKKITEHGEEGFAPLAWMLERRYPNEFGRPEVQLGIAIQNNVNTGANGKNFEIVVVEDLEFMGLRKRSEYTHHSNSAGTVREVEGSAVPAELGGHLSREDMPNGIVISRSEHEGIERRSAQLEAEVDKLLGVAPESEDGEEGEQD